MDEIKNEEPVVKKEVKKSPPFLSKQPTYS